ncbi:uncharacterized protein LOC126667194 [Mercurialis annua]|uniref:uncharacterized protein LOC126667194 n=1 Tax=Mercurialis annua TaxID=3986 RepID=UPI00215DD526|nr:uncharacterized protein LOC126667194 [Mercurialis annua]
MNVFDSPVEALAFNYVNFGVLTVVNNLWTWLALLTAAVSFWRIRSTVTITNTAACSINYDSRLGHESSPPVDVTSEPDEPATTIDDLPSCSPTPSSKPLVFEEDNLTKGTNNKFIMYYEDDRECDGGSVCGGDELTVVEEWGYRSGGWEAERVLKMRMGEMGWYRCQDLTVINGNVVRLWDDVVRRGKYSSG